VLGTGVQGKWHIGFTGRTSAGKSSLLNSILGRKPLDAGAAKTGHGETTMDITAYTCEKYPFLMLHDMPGYGTVRNPTFEYFV
jgi:GTP-binding protein EngB required for normal cell division